MNVITRYLVLFVLGIILLIVGVFVDWCTEVGLILLLLDVILSLIEQLKIHKMILEESDNPDF